MARSPVPAADVQHLVAGAGDRACGPAARFQTCWMPKLSREFMKSYFGATRLKWRRTACTFSFSWKVRMPKRALPVLVICSSNCLAPLTGVKPFGVLP